MNEVLSSDLATITTEIKSYQSIGGQAIFEIGRRLQWVKDNDLAHGDFIKWLDSIDVNRYVAARLMKVASELPNVTTSSHLGMTALYELATMPTDERDKPQQLPSGETKKPDEMTVRELREVKKQLKQREQELKESQSHADTLDTAYTLLYEEKEKLAHKQTKPEQVEVLPADYEDIKKRNEFLEQQYSKLLDSRQKVNQDAADKQELENRIKSLQGQLTDKQKRDVAYKRTSDYIGNANKLLDTLAPVAYAYDYQEVSDNERVNQQLRSLMNRVSKWQKDLGALMAQGEIIEGSFNNDSN